MAIGKRPSVKLIHKFSEGEECKGIIEFQGKVFVATTDGLYRLIPETEQLEKVELYEEEPQGCTGSAPCCQSCFNAEATMQLNGDYLCSDCYTEKSDD